MSLMEPTFIRRQFDTLELLEMMHPIDELRILTRKKAIDDPIDAVRTAALHVIDGTLGQQAAGVLFRIDGRNQGERTVQLLMSSIEYNKVNTAAKIDLQLTLLYNLIASAVVIHRVHPSDRKVLALDLVRQCAVGSPLDVELAKRLMAIEHWEEEAKKIKLFVV